MTLPENITDRIAVRNMTAQDAFLVQKYRIDALIEQLHELSDEHFDIHPDDIHWGHVGDLGRIAQLLELAVNVEEVS